MIDRITTEPSAPPEPDSRLCLRLGAHILINGISFQVDRIGRHRITLAIDPKVSRTANASVLNVWGEEYKPELWAVMKWAAGAQILKGLYWTEDEAAAVCEDDNWFIGPVAIGSLLPDESEWPGHYYPNAEAG